MSARASCEPLGVSDTKRTHLLPEVPTIDEAGVPGFQAANWWGIGAPAGTPPAVIAKLNTEINAVLDSPEVKKQFDNDGAVIVRMSPANSASSSKPSSRSGARWSRRRRSSLSSCGFCRPPFQRRLAPTMDITDIVIRLGLAALAASAAWPQPRSPRQADRRATLGLCRARLGPDRDRGRPWRRRREPRHAGHRRPASAFSAPASSSAARRASTSTI